MFELGAASLFAILDSLPNNICVTIGSTDEIVYVNRAFSLAIMNKKRAIGLPFISTFFQANVADRSHIIKSLCVANNPNKDDGLLREPLNAGILRTLCQTGAEQCPVYRNFQWGISRSDLIIQNDKSNQECTDPVPCYVYMGSKVSVGANEEQQLLESELLDFFQNAPIAIHWLDRTGKILWANSKELGVYIIYFMNTCLFKLSYTFVF